jgi:ABC-type cobalamin/Fe3+-siderophores transport system ATPase subunit
MLETLGYAHLAGRNFNRISGGERRIALLARALLQTKRNFACLTSPPTIWISTTST